MKNNLFIRAAAFLLALVCVVGVLPLSAFAADGLSDAPGSITQKSSKFMTVSGRLVQYESASSVLRNEGSAPVFDEEMEVPGYGTARALCAYFHGSLSPLANGQKWNYKEEFTSASLKVILTYIYSHANGDFTAAGEAAGSQHWGEGWTKLC